MVFGPRELFIFTAKIAFSFSWFAARAPALVNDYPTKYLLSGPTLFLFACRPKHLLNLMRVSHGLRGKAVIEG